MAGKVTVNQVQLGDSSTATQNFVWQTNADGTAKLARGNVGATTQDILTVDASGNVSMLSTPLWRTQVNAAQATTSGTFIDLPAVPSWVKRITLTLNGVSTNGTNNFLVQMGSGSIENTGYSGVGEWAGAVTAFTTGFGVINSAAANVHTGTIIINNTGSNLWVCSGGARREDATGIGFATVGKKNLSGTLDRLRFTTVGGTDTFDAGSISSIYEG